MTPYPKFELTLYIQVSTKERFAYIDMLDFDLDIVVCMIGLLLAVKSAACSEKGAWRVRYKLGSSQPANIENILPQIQARTLILESSCLVEEAEECAVAGGDNGTGDSLCSLSLISGARLNGLIPSTLLKDSSLSICSLCARCAVLVSLRPNPSACAEGVRCCCRVIPFVPIY